MNKKIEKFLLLVIFIAGYLSLSVQLIAIRQLGVFVGNTTITVSIIIGIFLACLTLGYYKGAMLKFNFKSYPRKIIANGFLYAAVFILLGCSHFFMELYFSIMLSMSIEFTIIQTFIYTILFFSFPPFVFGYIVSIASRYFDKYRYNYTGRIMAIDTIGSVLGSLLTTLVLMPFIGVNYTVLSLVIVAVFTYMYVAQKFSIINVAVIIGMAWFINSSFILQSLFNIVENNAVSTVAIVNTDKNKSQVLMINKSASSKLSNDKNLRFEYVKYIEDNFIKTLPKDKKYNILILGAGGFTMGLDDDFHKYTFVDVDKALLKIAEEKFLKQKLHNNKKFVVQDAIQFLKTKEKYDLIIMDTYSSRVSIPFQLLTKEYFERAKSKLAKEGIMVMNIITSANFKDDFSVNIDSTLQSVFPHLQRQTLKSINPWSGENIANIIYVYYEASNTPETIYTNDKNHSFYDNY